MERGYSGEMRLFVAWKLACYICAYIFFYITALFFSNQKSTRAKIVGIRRSADCRNIPKLY